MAGPWFAVFEDRGDWQTMDEALMSNGARHERVRVDVRVRLEDEA